MPLSKEAKKIYQHNWYLKNIDKCKKAQKAWYRDNKEKAKSDQMLWRIKTDYNKKRREKYNKEEKKNEHLKSLYGISLADYNKILNKQKGVCAICKVNNNKGIAFVVDHCHVTGKIRGLLCSSCNFVIGLVKEDEIVLKASIKYLRKWK